MAMLTIDLEKVSDDVLLGLVQYDFMNKVPPAVIDEIKKRKGMAIPFVVKRPDGDLIYDIISSEYKGIAMNMKGNRMYFTETTMDYSRTHVVLDGNVYRERVEV